MAHMLTITLGRGASMANRGAFKNVLWLGGVTDERTGMRGALMLGPTGAYFLVQRSATWPLDPLEVQAALEAEAGLREPPAPPRPMGRPIVDGGRKTQVVVGLTDEQREFARKLGKGNVSAGVRACVQTTINMLPPTDGSS